MLTEEYLKDNFLTAYFIDSERQNIEVQTTTEDKKGVFTTIIPYDENGEQFKALSKSRKVSRWAFNQLLMETIKNISPA